MRSRRMSRSPTLDGLAKWKLTCVSLGVSTRSMYRHTVEFSSRAIQNVAATSFDVNAEPSLHLIPERRFIVIWSGGTTLESCARMYSHLASAQRQIANGASKKSQYRVGVKPKIDLASNEM